MKKMVILMLYDDISLTEQKRLDLVETSFKTIFEGFAKDLSTLKRAKIFEIARMIGDTYGREHRKMEQVFQEKDFTKIPPEVNSKISSINTKYSLYVVNSLLKLKSYDLKEFDLDKFQEQVEREYNDIKNSLYFYVTNFLEGHIIKNNFSFSETFKQYNEIFYDGPKLRSFETMGDIVLAFLEGERIVFRDSEKIFIQLINGTITDFQDHLLQLKDLKEFSDFMPVMEQIYENANQAYNYLLENRTNDSIANYENTKKFYESLSGLSDLSRIVEDSYNLRIAPSRKTPQLTESANNALKKAKKKN